MAGKLGKLKRRSSKKKMSEMLMDIAQDHIALADDIEEKQQLLNGAASAWNIACLDEDKRGRAMKKFMRGYKKMNPGHTKQDCRDVEKDMEFLIKEKDRLYPDVKSQIAHVEIQEIRGKHHITVVSMTLR